jgi:hypothetical protein
MAAATTAPGGRGGGAHSVSFRSETILVDGDNHAVVQRFGGAEALLRYLNEKRTRVQRLQPMTAGEFQTVLEKCDLEASLMVIDEMGGAEDHSMAGSRVEVVGLVQKAVLNGQVGRALSFDRAEKRYRVVLGAAVSSSDEDAVDEKSKSKTKTKTQKKTIKVKPANLLLARKAEAEEQQEEQQSSGDGSGGSGGSHGGSSGSHGGSGEWSSVDGAEAQYERGCMFYDGTHGAPRNHAVAATWFHRSAAQGHSGAQLALGHCHRRGHGVSRDVAAAQAWCEYRSRMILRRFIVADSRLVVIDYTKPVAARNCPLYLSLPFSLPNPTTPD